MSGTRDTEMAIGAWQPMHTVEGDQGISGVGPYGDIHAFRMSLWTEHFRYWDPLFRFPAQLECTQKVNFCPTHLYFINKYQALGKFCPGSFVFP